MCATSVSRCAMTLLALMVALRAEVAGRTLDTGGGAPPEGAPDEIHVDPAQGNDRNRGTSEQPLKTVAAAVALLPDPLTRSITIRLGGGTCRDTGGGESSSNTLELMRRMRPGVVVRIVGRLGGDREPTIWAWEGGQAMVDVREGDWWLEDIQIGSGSRRQRRGVMVTGPGHVTLKNLIFRTCSHSGAGIYAHRGGKVSLRGAINLNEHLHDSAGEETFCGIIATDHGLVRFVEREGAKLDIGNGSLSAGYYGCIRLGCKTARITSWGEQSNNLAINNGGRIDLHGTTVTLRARQRRNTPIGLEHDGHILGEGAHVIIEGENSMAIALQKASTFTCNDIELRGTFDYCLWASSGSMFVGRFLTDVGRIEATTSATINIEKVSGKIVGPVVAKHGGVVSLPDRVVSSE
ncbi:MAG: hypothetical protein JSV19_05305 [Phycisphaerales bacterium]|nr:MAG: hypothetical protein JSV19_05305 [Phycisphaerales bacterium]